MPKVQLAWFLTCLTVLVPRTRAAEVETQRQVHQARSSGGMVVSASQLASEVGRNVLAEGGNAVDAAVAVAFALAATWPEAGNIGGGGFMLIRTPDGVAECVDYRECAPLNARPDMFTSADSTYSYKAVGVPGTVRGLATAHSRHGKLPWRRLVEPAATLARDGFELDFHLADSLNGLLQQRDVRTDDRYQELRRVYGRADGQPWAPGDRLVQPDLARTLQTLAEQGPEAFYRGPIAEALVADMRNSQGWITARDLHAYEALVRTPIEITYRDATILAPPPPSSGGICLELMLGMLDGRQLRDQPRYSADVLHLTAEAMRRAYAQRARHLGDPAFTPIPNQLRTREFADQLGASISPERATPSETLADGIELAPESPSTTHFSVIDQQGLAVSNTYTLEASFGSRMVVLGAGFLLNNEMGDFNWFPGSTTRSGRIGTPANLIAPGKRMLSSQTPVIVVKNDRPYVLTGSPGGRTIINTVATILLNVLEFELEFSESIAAPRIHHQWFPDQLILESDARFAPEMIEELRSRGHQVVVRGRQGSAHSIRVDPESGERHGVGDWRRGGFAAGVDRLPIPH